MELLSHLRKCFVAERVNRLGELPEVTMEAVMRHMPVHDAPKTLDWVQMGCIGRQIVQLEAAV